MFPLETAGVDEVGEVMILDYRVVHKVGRYAIHRVFRDEQGEIWTCTEDPVCPEGETPEELRR